MITDDGNVGAMQWSNSAHSSPPDIGQVVRLRTRAYRVEDVEKGGTGATVVRLACLDDDAQGQHVEVVWELELDTEILDETAWSSLGQRGFDDPRFFSARQAGDLPEHLRSLPSKIKGNDTTERRSHCSGIRWASERAIFSIDQRLEAFDKKPAVVLVSRHGVLVHPVVRMNSDNDDFLDGVHLIQHVNHFVSPPCVSDERFFLQEQVVPVVHVEDRIPLQRILVVTGRQKNSEAMLNTRGAGERRHQLAHAALRVFAKEWMNLQRGSRRCDSETIFSPR